MFENSILFCLFIFLILPNFSGNWNWWASFGRDFKFTQYQGELVLVNWNKKLWWTLYMCRHRSLQGKDEVKFLNIGKKHVLKRLFWMTFIKTCLWLSVQLQESEILLEFCSLAFIWIGGNRSRNSWVLHDILDLKTGMLASLEKILQIWAMWTLRSLRLLGSLKKKKQFSDLYVYLKTTF